MPAIFRVGTAGWSIPKVAAGEFPEEGTHLERYAKRFSAVEINSSFYRSHKSSTYERWAASVPPHFRFAVKMPREITHRRKLVDVSEPLGRFFAEVSHLDKKLGPILVQLPPSLRYDAAVVSRFFDDLRARFKGDLVCEPRHPTWFSEDVESVFDRAQIARVAADPAVVPEAKRPGGSPKITYRRLHGAPKIYYSPYSEAQIAEVAREMSLAPKQTRACWCIFDNTALGAATGDALALLRHLPMTTGSERPATG